MREIEPSRCRRGPEILSRYREGDSVTVFCPGRRVSLNGRDGMYLWGSVVNDARRDLLPPGRQREIVTESLPRDGMQKHTGMGPRQNIHFSCSRVELDPSGGGRRYCVQENRTTCSRRTVLTPTQIISHDSNDLASLGAHT